MIIIACEQGTQNTLHPVGYLLTTKELIEGVSTKRA